MVFEPVWVNVVLRTATIFQIVSLFQAVLARRIMARAVEYWTSSVRPCAFTK